MPIIGIDSAADSKAFTSFLTTDNVAGRTHRRRRHGRGDHRQIRQGRGRRRADHRICPASARSTARNKGFKEELAAKYPGLKLVADKVSDGQATTGLNIMTDLITANPNLRGVFADNLISARARARRSPRTRRATRSSSSCFDADDKLIGFLKDGTVAALVLQDPYRMGYDGIKTALAASKGEKVPANVDTGANLITKANMDGDEAAGAAEPEGQVIDRGAPHALAASGGAPRSPSVRPTRAPHCDDGSLATDYRPAR